MSLGMKGPSFLDMRLPDTLQPKESDNQASHLE